MSLKQSLYQLIGVLLFATLFAASDSPHTAAEKTDTMHPSKGGVFVAVGFDTAAAYSYDGITWQRSQGLPYNLLPWEHYPYDSIA